MAGLPAEEARAKVRKWNDIQEDFLEQTGLKRQYDREWVADGSENALENFQKHYRNEPKNGRIVTREKNKRGTFPASQEQIDDILANELKGLKLSAKPVYNARIGTPGMTKFEVYSWGEIKGVSIMEIGKQYKEGRAELLDTLVHEELEARIAMRPTKKHKELFASNNNTKIHKYIDEVIARYVRMKGL